MSRLPRGVSGGLTGTDARAAGTRRHSNSLAVVSGSARRAVIRPRSPPRQTRYVMLLAIGRDKTSQHVCALLAKKIRTLPQHLARSLTWDRGKELAGHLQFSVATGVQVYFCDPSSPWQRGSNENTNGLLR